MSEAEIPNGDPLNLDGLKAFHREYDAMKKRDEDEERKQAAFEKERQARVKNQLASELLQQKIFSTITVIILVVTILGTVFTFRESVVYYYFYVTYTAIPVLLAISFFAIAKIWMRKDLTGSDTSFVELDKRAEHRELIKAKAQAQAQMRAFSEELARVKIDAVNEYAGLELKSTSESAPVKDPSYDFVENIQDIISNLDSQIRYAEEKASRLLESGRSFIKMGISFYLITIIAWQLYLWGAHMELTPGMIVGMASCTILFITVEFLGAWFLKQYRHYGDSAFAYMKVRSMYGRHLLAYCAVFEFGDGGEVAKNDLLTILEKSEEWPELKDLNKNDFNHMLQSVEAVGVLFEKLKSIKKSKSAEAS
ncbi:hypothetical protein IAE35_05175 [Pseudomonas sp. S75]|uniref:hypothetical protein n=1 Tax=unclassified Pseudomonas TaxID=196821 RepID=UPI0019041F87|nr:MULTISPECIES: hypothetical protein [unclassified Pseudomonas]MBJ9975302.1 hypothetical protein [Pseudomonas sp. S30]MBK0152724.1 hypothetical protein [Pseudomonas sp. S75]